MLEVMLIISVTSKLLLAKQLPLMKLYIPLYVWANSDKYIFLPYDFLKALVIQEKNSHEVFTARKSGITKIYIQQKLIHENSLTSGKAFSFP